MNQRTVTIKDNPNTPSCPKCGNRTVFKCYSDYCAEDCCEVWCTCKCGYEPSNGDRVEDVWGGVHDNNCLDAIRFTWIDCLTPSHPKI